jgi:hypothetical protein
MRRAIFALVMLGACQMTAPADGPVAGTAAVNAGDIAVTTLDAPASQNANQKPGAEAEAVAVQATPATPHPKPRPGTETATPQVPTAEPEVLEVPKTAEQLLCEKTGGQWGAAGDTGTFICLRKTRDAGKSCRKKGDCQGLCLARSGTCSPFTPLYGCNEIFEADGRRVTLCLN